LVNQVLLNKLGVPLGLDEDFPKQFRRFLKIFPKIGGNPKWPPGKLTDRVHLNKLGSLCPKGCFLPNIIEIGLVVLENTF
jgi:hypothetical protein